METNYKALIVEDDLRWFHVFQEEIINNPNNLFNFIHATNLGDALSALVKNSDISVIFLDLILPDSEGEETIKKILSHSGYTPVIVLTVMNDPTMMNAAFSHGVQDYLVKDQYDAKLFFHVTQSAIHRMMKHLQDDATEQIKSVKEKLKNIEKRLAVLEQSYQKVL